MLACVSLAYTTLDKDVATNACVIKHILSDNTEGRSVEAIAEDVHRYVCDFVSTERSYDTSSIKEPLSKFPSLCNSTK